jgi:hypothetical protein
MAEGAEIKDLFSLIEESSVECLNQDATHTVEHCFKQVSVWLDFTFQGAKSRPWRGDRRRGDRVQGLRYSLSGRLLTC